VFERFTDRARYVVVLAQEEARWLNHNYIGTEHILLGLIHEADGVAAKALESLSISLESVRRQVEEIIGQGEAAPTGHIPFTSRAKMVLEQSFREALQLGHNYIGTEHILLGLIREGEGVGSQILQKLGADINRVRQTVIQQLSESAAGIFGEEVPPAGSMPPKVLRSPSPFEDREKVVLSFLINEGLSTSELANLLGVSEEKVGEILQAVIEKLKHVGE
jgi:ATP-dependent Clp protease ATP-binding subunit ClpC